MKVFISYEYRFRGGGDAIRKWKIVDMERFTEETLKDVEIECYKETGGWDAGYTGITLLNVSVIP